MHDSVVNFRPNLCRSGCRCDPSSGHGIEVHSARIALARNLVERWLEVIARIGRVGYVRANRLVGVNRGRKWEPVPRHIIKCLRVEHRLGTYVSRRYLHVLQNARQVRRAVRAYIANFGRIIGDEWDPGYIEADRDALDNVTRGKRKLAWVSIAF